MTLLSVVKDVCATVGVLLPQSVFSGISGNRTMQEMLSLANETAHKIAYDQRDWTVLRTTQTYYGNEFIPPGPGGVPEQQTAFDLPENYKRMLMTSNVWRTSSTQQPLRFIANTDEWMNRRAREEVNGFGEWTMLGGQIHIFPALYTGEAAYFAYLNKNCIKLASGGSGNAYSDRFMEDGDSFRLDERTLKLGMIAFWKAQKGSPYAEDLATYTDALANVSGRDSPAPILVSHPLMSDWGRDASF